MSLVELMDEDRETLVGDATLSPTRSVIYRRASDGSEHTVNSYVGAGQFNKVEKENIEDHQAFGGLKLDFIPRVNDSIEYDGILYGVRRYAKLGSLYTVYGEIRRSRGKSK